MRWLYTWTSPDGQCWNQSDYTLCSQRWRSSIQSAKTRLGADCGSDHELLIAKFRLKLKKVGKTGWIAYQTQLAAGSHINLSNNSTTHVTTVSVNAPSDWGRVAQVNYGASYNSIIDLVMNDNKLPMFIYSDSDENIWYRIYIYNGLDENNNIIFSNIEDNIINYMTVSSTDNTWILSSVEIQPKLTAGTNISFNGNTISATDTTYSSLPASQSGVDVSLVTTGEKYIWNNKQNSLEFNTAYDAATNKVATMSDITSAVSNVYKLQGTESVTALNNATKTADMHGYVFNLSDSGNLINSDNSVVAVLTGDNVVFLWSDSSHWEWDKLASTIDLSGYAQKSTSISSSSAGVALGGTINSPTVTVTGGSVSSGNTSVVTGGTVYTALSNKQDALSSQTAYTSKGTSTKVPQITTNSLGQVTGISEVNIAFPTELKNPYSVNLYSGSVSSNNLITEYDGSAVKNVIFSQWTKNDNSEIGITISDGTVSKDISLVGIAPASSGGTFPSLVTTGEKYIWDNKQNALTTSSVNDGTINKAIGFDNNGNLIKGTVSGGDPNIISNATINALFGYSITTTVTNGTASGALFIYTGETATITITPSTGYVAPSSVTITNATQVSYDSSTGVLVIGSATGAVSISVVCNEAPAGYQITVSNGNTNHYPMATEVYTGNQGSAGTLLGTVAVDDSETFTITSEYISVLFEREGYNISTTGGASYTGTTSDGNATYGVYQITGNGTISMKAGSCFVEGTQITLADGSTKNVENIIYDDELLVWNFYEGKYDTAKPSWIMQESIAFKYKLVTFSDGNTLKLVGPDEKSHRLYNVTKQKFLYANECLGDEIYTQNGIVTMTGYDIIEEEVKYYNLTTEKYYDCFANGVLTGSRLNNMYEINDMKYTNTDNRLISEEEEAERWAIRERLRWVPTE